MKEVEIIHLVWKEYEWDESIFNKFNGKEDYGIYQIYGDHPIYGQNTLLYIGKANENPYSQRLYEHSGSDFDVTHISKFRKLHLSYFCENDDINKNNWKDKIDLVEKLLINSHSPAYNSQDIKNVLAKEIFEKELLVLNWGERGKLLPEVSSLKTSRYYWDTDPDLFNKILKH